VLELQDFTLDVDRDLLGQVAVGHGGGHFGDVAHLGGQVAGHEVNAVGQVFPGAGDALDVGLAAELALGTDLAGDTSHLGRERAKLIHHRVDGVLQLQDFALDVDGDLLGQVAVGHGFGHVRTVASLAGQVARHGVHTFPTRLPSALDALDVGLAAELALGADLAGDTSHLRGERAKLIDHRVDGVLELENFALDVDGDFFGQVAVGH